MIEKEIGSWSFAFELVQMVSKPDFIEAGMTELKYLCQDAITQPGKYAFKLTMVELVDTE